MTNVHDLAAYILRQHGEMSTTKLHKLCYYAQGHSLAWDGEPLFHEELQAWSNGPVCAELFHRHQGRFNLETCDPEGDPEALSQDQRETIDAVLDAYGHLTGFELSVLAASERPWREARGDLHGAEPSHNPIDLDVMQQFFVAEIASDVPADKTPHHGDH
ncbi:MAG: Panacea domain-containing protein [Micrococcales bacterium]|nr:Panacea domain-containing protein [Micrococcales bacterium]